jgi:hypothetical protein
LIPIPFTEVGLISEFLWDLVKLIKSYFLAMKIFLNKKFLLHWSKFSKMTNIHTTLARTFYQYKSKEDWGPWFGRVTNVVTSRPTSGSTTRGFVL